MDALRKYLINVKQSTKTGEPLKCKNKVKCYISNLALKMVKLSPFLAKAIRILDSLEETSILLSNN